MQNEANVILLTKVTSRLPKMLVNQSKRGIVMALVDDSILILWAGQQSL